MYEKSIQLVGDFFVLQVRYDGSRLFQCYASFEDARAAYDNLRPECGDHDGPDSAIRSDVVYPRTTCR